MLKRLLLPFTRPGIWLAALLLFFSLLYTVITGCNHYFFRTNAFDYGAYNYAFWDFAHGHVSPSPVYALVNNINFLQDHFSLTLPLLTPFYWLLNWLTGTYTLLLIQNILTIWSGWAVYRLVKLKTGDAWLGLAALFSYFVMHSRYSQFSADCNLGIMCAALMPLFLWFFESGRHRLALGVFVFALLSRENMPVWFIFIFSVLLLWHWKEKQLVKYCTWYMVVSLVYFILLFKVIIPAFERPGHPYTLFNYSALGANPLSAGMHMLRHPIDSFLLLFQNPTGNPSYDGVKQEYYLVYLISGGFMLFFRPTYFIWFLPLLAQKMWNDLPVRWSIEGYYAIETATLLPLAALLILGELKLPKIRYGIAIMLCILPLGMTYYKLDARNRKMGWSGTLKENIADPNFFHGPLQTRKIYEALHQIPPDAPVSASEHLLPHLAQRKGIYFFPDTGDAVYIAFFTNRDNYMLTPAQYQDWAGKYLHDPDWKQVTALPGFVLLKRKDIPATEPRP